MVTAVCGFVADPVMFPFFHRSLECISDIISVEFVIWVILLFSLATRASGWAVIGVLKDLHIRSVLLIFFLRSTSLILQNYFTVVLN